MTQLDIAQQRLHNQHIAQQTLTRPSEIAQWFGGLQAQDYHQAEWALGLRLVGATAATIAQAVAEKSIIRTWPWRGTLHLVAATDLGWMLGLLAGRHIAGNARRYRELELDEPTLLRTNALIAEALADAPQLTRQDLSAVIEKNGISTTGQRMAYMLQRAALDGLVARGANDGPKTTYLPLDAALTHDQALPKADALAELARRYFQSHGPATLHDFARWAGLPIGDARTGVAGVKAEFEEAKFNDTSYWWRPCDPPTPATGPTAFVLPGYDEYLLGYQARLDVLDPAHAPKIVPGGNGVFRPMLIMDGRIVGTWKRAVKKGKLVLSIEPFQPLSTAERESIRPAAERYGAFLRLPVELAD